ncbi:MAG: aminotransferase class III-fold pyridoxal phosphate-dependent enzyme, partial [Miltoncostaeaceae bacterium]
LLDGLRALVADRVAVEARGRGLMCAIDLPTARAGEVVDAMLAEGYLINNTTARTLRFLPPLVISAEQVDGLLAALRRVLGRA